VMAMKMLQTLEISQRRGYEMEMDAIRRAMRDTAKKKKIV